jgi:hypothetical protein
MVRDAHSNREASFHWERGRPRPQLSANREQFLRASVPREAGEGARAPSDAKFEHQTTWYW